MLQRTESTTAREQVALVAAARQGRVVGAVIRNHQVTVAERDGAIEGVLVLRVTDEGFLVDNVAVHPARRGQGLGRSLLELAEAEARRAGFDSVYLYTHEQMTENLALYSRIGYVEYDRRSEGAFSRVFMRKRLR